LADSLEQEYSTSLALRDLGQSYAKQQMEVENDRLKNHQLRITLYLLLLLMGLCLVVLVGVLLYRLEKQKRKRELARLMQQIREKEQMIEDLQVSLPAPSSKHQAFDLLYRLKSEPRYGLVKTEDEWFQLFAVINRLYGDIVGKLEGCPQLTGQDVRVCYLIHARMSNATLGVLFNVDSRSVVKSKQRIKKKMGIASDLSLEEYLMK
jgi:cell division protein FtsL